MSCNAKSDSGIWLEVGAAFTNFCEHIRTLHLWHLLLSENKFISNKSIVKLMCHSKKKLKTARVVTLYYPNLVKGNPQQYNVIKQYTSTLFYQELFIILSLITTSQAEN